jgi:DNA end-binding protein Ku
MATTVWKGHLTFGLVSIPVKLFRAARAEKVSFRQLHQATGARIRQALIADVPEEEPEQEIAPTRGPALVREPAERSLRSGPARGSFPEAPPPKKAAPPPEPDFQPREVARSEIVKGFEYTRGHYVTLTRDELEKITPKTAREMELMQFVKLDEVDPIYFETSYYIAPDKGGERAYSLLFNALRTSGFAGIAQVAMHNREHVVVVRPGRTGLILHTLFYESEIRREDEYRTETAGLVDRERELALLLIQNLSGPFDPSQYRDAYREKLDALIQQKLDGREVVTSPAATPKPVVNILEALERSLASAAKKPPAIAGKGPGRHRRAKS